ncbi:Gamma-tubulin complex component 4 [Haplosporangium sp. Z 767]|nr:Gamma-tubulin complex component 4 [Haplosporangium sp. Z 767]
MLHELLITLSGFPGDIFRPFPLEPEVATTFAITDDFPFLHPAEKEGLDRLAQLGFYFKDFNDFILSCRSPSPYSASIDGPPPHPSGLYLKALVNALEKKLQSYRRVIVDTEAAILSGEDNLGGMVPLSTIAARFAPFQLVFPALSNLIAEIRITLISATPLTGGKLIDLLQEKAASGVPIQQEWMNELLQGCCAVMMRQIVSWVIYGQIQDPFGEFFIVRLQSTSEMADSEPERNAQHSTGGSTLRPRSFTSTRMSSSAALTSSLASASNSVKWKSEYALDEDMIPTMIPNTLACAMLFIGKSIATARQAKPKPIPIPQSMTERHLNLILPFLSSASVSSADLSIKSISGEVLNTTQLTNVIHQIRKDIANHLWVVVQVGEKVVRTLESFRRYFLLCDGEFGLRLIEALNEFKRNRLSRLGRFTSGTSTSVSVRDHDLGGLLTKAAQNTPAQDDPALHSFELRLLRPSKIQANIEGSSRTDHTAVGMFDDQLLGIPVRLWYTLTWPLDSFLTAEDLEHYGDVFAFLVTVRKAQVRLQQTWIEVKSMVHQMNSRKRGRGTRAYKSRIKGTETDDAGNLEQEAEMLKYIAAIRSDMVFVVDCLWTYIQMDVIGPTFDSLLQSIMIYEFAQRKHGGISSVMDSSSATSQTFDSIHSLHAEALYEIRRACFLTSERLALSVKNILEGAESFCGLIGRRAASQDGFQAGLGPEQDESMWQDWTDISQLNQVFRENTEKLFSDLSVVSKSGSLGDRPVLKQSVSGLGSSLLGNGPKSFDLVRQVDQLLLRLEYSKSGWFSQSKEPLQEQTS